MSLLNCEIYQRGLVLGLLTWNSYYLSHTSCDHQVQFLVYDELLNCKIYQRVRMSSLLTQNSYY